MIRCSCWLERRRTNTGINVQIDTISIEDEIVGLNPEADEDGVIQFFQEGQGFEYLGSLDTTDNDSYAAGAEFVADALRLDHTNVLFVSVDDDRVLAFSHN